MSGRGSPHPVRALPDWREKIEARISNLESQRSDSSRTRKSLARSRSVTRSPPPRLRGSTALQSKDDELYSDEEDFHMDENGLAKWEEQHIGSRRAVLEVLNDASELHELAEEILDETIAHEEDSDLTAVNPQKEDIVEEIATETAEKAKQIAKRDEKTADFKKMANQLKDLAEFRMTPIRTHAKTSKWSSRNEPHEASGQKHVTIVDHPPSQRRSVQLPNVSEKQEVPMQVGSIAINRRYGQGFRKAPGLEDTIAAHIRYIDHTEGLRSKHGNPVSSSCKSQRGSVLRVRSLPNSKLLRDQSNSPDRLNGESSRGTSISAEPDKEINKSLNDLPVFEESAQERTVRPGSVIGRWDTRSSTPDVHHPTPRDAESFIRSHTAEGNLGYMAQIYCNQCIREYSKEEKQSFARDKSAFERELIKLGDALAIAVAARHLLMAHNIKAKTDQLVLSIEKLYEAKLQQEFEEEFELFDQNSKKDVQGLVEEWAKKIKSGMKQLDIEQKKLVNQCQLMMKNFVWEDYLQCHPFKPSKDLQSLKRSAESLVKLKEYKTAHEVLQRCDELEQREMEEWNSKTKLQMQQEEDRVRRTYEVKLEKHNKKATTARRELEKQRDAALEEAKGKMSISRHSIETKCQQQINKAKKDLHSFVISIQGRTTPAAIKPKKKKHGSGDKKGSRGVTGLGAQTDSNMVILIGGTNGKSTQETIDVSHDINVSPCKSSWISGSKTQTPRKSFAAVFSKIRDQVWIIGGKHTSDFHTTELWNLTDSQSVAGPDMMEPRSKCAAAVHNNLLFVFGGENTRGVLRSTEMLDMSAKQLRWKRAHDMAAPRMGAVACNFGSLLYIFGGHDGNRILDSVAALSPEASGPGIWLKLPSMVTARTGATCIVVEKQIWIIGGVGETGVLASTEIFDPHESLWKEGPDLQIPRSDAAAVCFRGCLWVLGGNTVNGVTDTVETLTVSEQWTWSLGPKLPAPKAFHCAVVSSTS